MGLLDSRSARLGREMVGHLDPARLLRLHVDFGRIKHATRTDWLVGRSAHIEFLLSHRFFSTLVAAYPTFFRLIASDTERLAAVVRDINGNCKGLPGLCRDFPERLRMLRKSKGDRLRF